MNRASRSPYGLFVALLCSACVVEGSAGNDRAVDTDHVEVDSGGAATSSDVASPHDEAPLHEAGVHHDAATASESVEEDPTVVHEAVEEPSDAAVHEPIEAEDSVPIDDVAMHEAGSPPEPVSQPEAHDASAELMEAGAHPDASIEDAHAKPHADAAEVPLECQPGMASECYDCLGAACCDALVECHAAEPCWCIQLCVEDGATVEECQTHCGSDGGQEYAALSACSTDQCAAVCH